MAFSGEVAHDIGIPYHDYNEENAFYVRVCALVKILYGIPHADGIDR